MRVRSIRFSNGSRASRGTWVCVDFYNFDYCYDRGRSQTNFSKPVENGVSPQSRYMYEKVIMIIKICITIRLNKITKETQWYSTKRTWNSATEDQ